MNPFEFIIIALATWRLSRLIAQEDGPFALLRKFRDRAKLGGLFDCIYCVSLYVGAGVYALWLYAPIEIVYVFAISGLAMILHRWTGGDHL